MYKPVDKSFFQAPVLELAQNLLGQYIVHEQPEGFLSPELSKRKRIKDR